MKNVIRKAGLIIIMFHSCYFMQANTHIVVSGNEFKSVLEIVEAGDTIIWKSGVYSDVDLFVGKSNLVIMAEVSGKTIFTGSSSAYFAGSYITFSGFQFLNGNIGANHLINVSGSHNHFTQMNIKGYYCAKYFVIGAESQYNLLTYCNFESRAFIGNENILSILVSENTPGYHTLRYCSFKNFEGPGGDFGTEPIRIGLSTMGEFISRSTVEYCYFTQCSGDSEIISNKSRQNVYRYNTFEDNPYGELVLRHGDEGVVYGNFFIHGAGGVRIKEGQHHVIFNNYFYDIKDEAIYLMNYVVDPLSDITFAYNTFINCAPLELNGSGSYSPTNITFANNIFANPKSSLFTKETGTENWIGNIAFGSLGMTQPEGIRVADPKLIQNSDGYYGLSEGSTAIDSAQAGYPDLPNYSGMGIDYLVEMDLMQQARPSDIALKDIGCNEFPQNETIKPYVNEKNTGPSYLFDTTEVYIEVIREGEGSVTIEPAGGIYKKGTVITLTAEPTIYTEFKEWGADLKGSKNPDTLVMNSNKKVIAYFDALPLHKVEFYVSGLGHVDVEPPGWNYLDSTWITLTAVPDSGYIFKNWTGNIVETANPLTLLVTKSIVGFANFEIGTGVDMNSMTTPGFHVFPNPAQNRIKLIINQSQFKSVEIELYDMVGRKIKSIVNKTIDFEHSAITLDISNLSKGVYVIGLNYLDKDLGNQVLFQQQKFIKQ